MEIKQLLINQYFQEIKNSLFYASLSSECSHRNLMGFCNFFKNHSLEEFLHSRKILYHLLNTKISFPATYNLVDNISNVKQFNDNNFIKEFLNESLKREKENSNNFQKIMEKIEKTKEYVHQDIIMWFINEQVEEKIIFQKLIKKFKTSHYNLYHLDKELSQE